VTRKVVTIVVEEIRKGKCFVFMKSKIVIVECERVKWIRFGEAF
jgi:hypothetical protein